MMDEYYDDIQNAIEVLRKGGLILYPTDTIWGIGCDATNALAVKKVYELKQREDTKSMLILLENPNLILSYVEEVPEVGWDIIELAEKPTTIIYDGAKNIALNMIAEDGSIGIRITREEFTQKLIKKFRKPLVSTSANFSGQPSPKNFSEISEEIKSKVDYIVNYRQDDDRIFPPSSIIKLGASGLVKIIRE